MVKRRISKMTKPQIKKDVELIDLWYILVVTDVLMTNLYNSAVK